MQNCRKRASRHPLYAVWSRMRSRCLYVGDPHFVNYGGRGITICPQWIGRHGFKTFVADMGDRPQRHTLERIDNSKGYSPGNCRWATRHEQARNKRNNKMLTHDGKTLCLQEWSEVTGIDVGTLGSRLNRLGWSVADALTIRPGTIPTGPKPRYVLS